jgi:hypothetical protein
MQIERPCRSRSGPAYRAILPVLWRDPVKRTAELIGSFVFLTLFEKDAATSPPGADAVRKTGLGPMGRVRFSGLNLAALPLGH